jgi:membrane-anchored mycosin MYCP
MSRRLSAVLAGAVLGALAPAVAMSTPALPAAAEAAAIGPVPAAPGDNCAQPADVDAGRAWPRTMLAADSVWPFTRGGGATVAVLSTGVDADQPQLRGRVLAGFDAVAGRGAADSDCTGTGTQVAGVIAARPSEKSGVAGLAPSARIQPVRVVADDSSGTVLAEPGPLARGVAWSVTQGVDVIVVATPVYRETPALREAVTDALARGVVVVAAAGDLGGADAGNPTPYPATYSDVLGVGAVGSDGQVWEDSPAGEFVDLVAPGVAVPTVQRGTGLVQVDGTAVAAGFVGGVAALLRARRGDLPGTEIVRTIVATASPAPLGLRYGAGVVSPYSALTEQIVAPSARPVPDVVGAPSPVTGVGRHRRDLALAGAGLAVIVVVVVLLVTAALRRRSWRPGLPEALPRWEEPIEPGPPVMLLDDPAEARTS